MPIMLHDLTKGAWYRIVWQSPNHKYPHEAKMIYLGLRYDFNSLVFSARPVAGTQMLPIAWILKMEPCKAPKAPYLDHVLRSWRNQ